MSATLTADPARGVDPGRPDPRARIGRHRALVAEALDRVVPAGRAPEGLYAPMRFVLEGEGKRLRPVLVLLAAEACGARAEDALPAALAAEVFHNFTLVHDDIMDHAATRRGRPTVHVRWDEPTAILAGDLLMGEAYRLLAETPRGDLRALFAAFATMVTRLCEGQALDKQFETEPAVSVERYLDMIDRKTGALLEHCLEAGALVAGAPDAHADALRAAGHAAGRAFQIMDDLLDLVADDVRWGKTVGGDLVEGKKAFLLLRALEASNAAGDAATGDAAFFGRIASERGLAPALVPDARARMERLGVLDDARAAIAAYTDDALAHLHALPPTEARDALVWLVRDLSGRLH